MNFSCNIPWAADFRVALFFRLHFFVGIFFFPYPILGVKERCSIVIVIDLLLYILCLMMLLYW